MHVITNFDIAKSQRRYERAGPPDRLASSE